jgi:sec-independent protein translocase protein TatB
MLFDIGWPELLLIGVVALVVIGPKDLPRALRTAGFWVRKARTLSREFQSSIDQMIREAELDEVRQDLKKVTEFDLEKEFQNTVDPTGELAQSIKPPDLPDYFEEPGAATPPVTPEVPALSAPTETALPEPAPSAEGTPEPAASAPGPSEGSPAAAAPDHQPPPKP